MSLRGTKRASGVRGEEAGTSKRRRTEHEDALWQLRPVSDLKMSSIYNRSASEAPAELFRKDLISAMKLPDNEPLTPSSYWIITDTWKQDWERGVQVPVNPDSLPAPKVKIIENELPPNFKAFKLPKEKYLHLTRDANYASDKHILSTTPAKAEANCSYDLDATDTAWLKLLNAERARAGAAPVTEDQLEKVIEELEVRTWDKIQAIIKSEEGLGIEYDENVICDVCRSPDSEDGNEMVFCDSCNICVHQACYGITDIPDGQWLCRPCADGARPSCVLCPNHGGAMKCTPSGHKWAHVSCVLWIPEVSIGCAEIMEPITKISSIPASRWSLVCVLCKNRKGACIQCSVKTCKTAYHVTCAFKHGLEMRAIIEDENADDGVKLRSYCQKHSMNTKKEKCPNSGSEEEEVKRKRRKDMTSEEKTQARAARLQEIEREFDKHVCVKDISSHLLDVDQDAINYIYNYWKLKRRSGHNRPLLPPKSDDSELLTHRQEKADLDKMKKFVQLRQDLERVRNLCYMVSRREKLSRSFFRMREQTFHKQVAVLSADPDIPAPELAAIIEANHGPSIYDRLYSHPNAPDHKNDFEALLARIAPPDSGDEKKKDRNGLAKGSKSSNPYKKHYVNGSRRSGSMYSGLSSEESAPEMSRPSRYRGKAIGSSTDDERKKTATSPKKKVSPKGKGKRSPKKVDRRKKKVPQSKAVIESSSEDETMQANMKKDKSRSKTLTQLEKEMTAGKMGQSGTDSDDLMPMRSTRNNKFPVDIYSDSSEDAKSDPKPDNKADKSKTDKIQQEKSPSGNDSQQSLPRTKAAMKEFIPTQPEKKTVSPKADKPAPKKRGRKPSNKEKKLPPSKHNESDDEAKNKENIKFSKQKDNPTDLIVPQRQAAKKASENMRSTTAAKKDDAIPEKQTSGDDTKVKTPVKAKSAKGKEVKDTTPTKTKTSGKKSKEVEKEPISYVPQRQAAKKAAAHIKSGLGTKPAAPETEVDKKKDDKAEPPKSLSPRKDDAKASKSGQKESSTSSSNSSSSSYSSSSSSEDEPEKPGMKPTAKAREIKPAVTTRPPSMFSPPGSRPTVDLPFLDRVSRPLSSTSASSDSESSKESERSGSVSPCPKRPRRRRKGKSISTDVSPRKAPDKKLKTSERRSECGVPSPTAEGEEPSRPDARAATRARTRSTTSGGNMPNKPDARPRKPSKDDAGITHGSNKTPKESGQPSELSTPERKTNEAVKKDQKTDPPQVDAPKTDAKPKTPKTTRRSESADDKDKDKDKNVKLPEITSPVNKASPRKSIENKLKNRRMSVKEPAVKERVNPARDPPERASRPNRHEPPAADTRPATSPIIKPTVTEKPPAELENKKSPLCIGTDYRDNDKHWLPKVPSPNADPPPVEKPGGNEKYMTDDKSMDSDYADKTSVKMIAKIQANLNENTMIKSPKTPMDARTMGIEHMDVENVARNMRKRSAEKKFITQDASHVQGVEISKSAKIPSAMNPYPNRSMFSPQSKDNELFDFELMAVDDGFNHDGFKPFTFPEFYFKEDSKEQGVQETLNLVDRLRMQLSSKKPPTENPPQDGPIVIDDNDKDDRREGNNAPIDSVNAHRENDTVQTKTSPPSEPAVHRSPSKEVRHINHVPRSPIERDLPSGDPTVDNKHYLQPVPMTSNEKWSNVNTPHIDSQSQANDRKFDSTSSSFEDAKEPINVNSDINPASEAADTISLSKQSDDSQSISVVDHSVHSNDQELTQDHQNFDNNDILHSDRSGASPGTYVYESKITTRRSSASSTNSETSVGSHKTGIKPLTRALDVIRPVNVMPDIDPYSGLPVPAYSRPVEPSMPLNQYTTYPADASPFLSSLPLFASGACGPSMLPLPSPSPHLYPFPGPPLLPPKPPFSLCAAFTSSSQNIALTTAMIAPPTPKPADSPRGEDVDVTGSDKFSIHVASSPSISVDSFDANGNSGPPTVKSNDSNEAITVKSNDSNEAITVKSNDSNEAITVKSNDSNETITVKSNDSNETSTVKSNNSNETIANLHTQESKSPHKPSRLPTKFPGKSPGKSPGISPKQSEGPKGTKRPSNRSNRSQRGRGRSKSRGQAFPRADYMVGSIQSKLVGTVYDFDEEIANDGVDLKALRDKRKSIDDRKSEHSSRSPRVPSPLQNKKPPVSELKDIKPPHTPEPNDPDSSPSSKSERGPGFSQVAPVLPGPVDMRTYQPFENPAPAPGDAYHLLAFASGTADQHLPELDEEAENQLHTALRASNPKTGSPYRPPEPAEPPKETFTPHLLKVSLSDSRNQLKVKIKGPFLDANYSTSSSTPVAPPPPAPVYVASAGAPDAPGSGNLRRMRKKELLRQYWTQERNNDEPAPAAAPPPAQPSPLTRANVITIPKAVASMTSIPTREDYKLLDTPFDKKKRKTTGGLARELRHLEVSMKDEPDPEDVKPPIIAPPPPHKRRGRASVKPNRASVAAPLAPKLKIKIGSNTVQHVHPLDESGDASRPPKKRSLAHKPSLEDLRRESMKYRRMVMADFEEDEKTTKTKPTKSEKRKKKKDKKTDKLQVVNSESESATKLIIKIKREVKKEEEGSETEAGASTRGAGASGGSAAGAGAVASAGAGASAAAEPFDPFEYDPSAPDPLAIEPPSYSESSAAMRKVRTDKVTPIRLKLARSSEGYVMKEPGDAAPASPLPLALNKHCEVR